MQDKKRIDFKEGSAVVFWGLAVIMFAIYMVVSLVNFGVIYTQGIKAQTVADSICNGAAVWGATEDGINLSKATEKANELCQYNRIFGTSFNIDRVYTTDTEDGYNRLLTVSIKKDFDRWGNYDSSVIKSATTLLSISNMIEDNEAHFPKESNEKIKPYVTGHPEFSNINSKYLYESILNQFCNITTERYHFIGSKNCWCGNVTADDLLVNDCMYALGYSDGYSDWTSASIYITDDYELSTYGNGGTYDGFVYKGIYDGKQCMIYPIESSTATIIYCDASDYEHPVKKIDVNPSEIQSVKRTADRFYTRDADIGKLQETIKFE